MNVGHSTVARAKQIKETAPEVFDKLKVGEFRSVEAAHRAAGLAGSDSGRSRLGEESEPKRNGKTPPGPRLNLPAGRTAEDVCREAMEAEAAGMSAEDSATGIGVGISSYRRMRYVVMLADRQDLSDRNAELVSEALALMNKHAIIGPPFEMVEPLVNRIYGAGSRSGALDRMEANQREKFDRAYGALIQTCEAMSHVETPHLSPEDSARCCDELKAAARHIEIFRRRILEDNR